MTVRCAEVWADMSPLVEFLNCEILNPSITDNSNLPSLFVANYNNNNFNIFGSVEGA